MQAKLLQQAPPQSPLLQLRPRPLPLRQRLNPPLRPVLRLRSRRHPPQLGPRLQAAAQGSYGSTRAPTCITATAPVTTEPQRLANTCPRPMQRPQVRIRITEKPARSRCTSSLQTRRAGTMPRLVLDLFSERTVTKPQKRDVVEGRLPSCSHSKSSVRQHGSTIRVVSITFPEEPLCYSLPSDWGKIMSAKAA